MQSDSNSTSNILPETDKNLIHYSKYVFSLLGVCSFLSWNVFTHIVNLMSTHIYGDPNIGDTMLLIFEAAPLTAMLTFAYIGGVRPIALCCNLILGAIFSIALALQVFFTENADRTNIILLYITAALLGLSMGATLTLGYSLSSITYPVVFSGQISLGQSLGQVFSFTAFLIGNEIIWPRDKQSISIQSLKNTILFLFCISAILHIIGSVSLFLLFKTLWYSTCIKASKIERKIKEEYSANTVINEIKTDIDEDNNCNSIMDMRPPRKFKYIIKDASWTLSTLFLWGSLYFLIFPLIVPYAWTGSDFKHNLIGIYQITDILVRYIFNFFNSKISITSKQIFFSMAARVLFIPPGLLPMILTSTFSNTTLYQTFYICLFAITNGSLIILAMLRAPLCVTRVKERAKVGAYCSFSIQFGTTFGIFASKGLKIIIEAFMNS